MKKIIILFMVIYSYGIYSFQLYTSVNQKYAKLYYEKLSNNIKQKSFIYRTDSGYYTVRYLITKYAKELRKLKKQYPIVKDDINKLKNINSSYIKDTLVKLNIIKPKITPKQKPILKPISKPKPKIKPTKIVLPDWVKMNIALQNNDTYKIEKLLNTKIGIYQKITALDKLQRYNDEEDTIFKYESITNDKNLYNRYFKLNTKKYVSFRSIFEIKDGYNNSLNSIIYKNKYSLQLNYDNVFHQNNKEVLVGYKNITIGLRESQKTFISIKAKKELKIDKIDSIFKLGFNQKSLDNDLMFNTTINHFISLNLSKTTHNHYLSFKSVFSKYYYQTSNFAFNKSEISLNDIYRYDSLLNFSSYIKNVTYSNILQSYNEIGIGSFYGYSKNHLKTAKYFINPIITYNTLSNIGYNISLGMNKRVIKADNLKVVLSYSKDQFGDTAKIIFNYIYY